MVFHQPESLAFLNDSVREGYVLLDPLLFVGTGVTIREFKENKGEGEGVGEIEMSFHSGCKC